MTAAALAVNATSNDVHNAPIQRGSPNRAEYQRSENPGGGNAREAALEKDIGTTTSTGRQRNTRTDTAQAASIPRAGRRSAAAAWSGTSAEVALSLPAASVS